MKKIRYRYLIGNILLAVTLFLVLAGNRSLYLNNIEEQNQNYSKKTSDEIDIIFRSYKDMTDIIYHQIINTPEIAQHLYLSHKHPATAGDHRKSLQKHVSELYAFLLQYHYRQLHFHLPDTASFLRMHRPEKYGDILSGVRSTVRYVNEYKKPAIGFEEGRIVNGYRFVYPLFYQGNHAGSVEISVSMKAVIRIMEDLFENSYGFIIKKETVMEKVFEEELKNYETCGLSSDYFIDKEISSADICRNLPKTLKNKPKKERTVAAKLSAEEDFTIYLNERDFKGALTFISIKNFDGRHVGYLYTLNNDHIYRHFLSDFHRSNIIILFFFLLLSAAFTFLIYANNKFRNLAIVDKLTNTYSRHFFHEFYKKLVQKLSREEKTMILIMADIDHFKEINDTFGHPAGDQVLKQIASIFVQNIRSSDIVARWGGEEFVFLIDNINLENGVKVAEKIRHLVEDADYGKAGRITCSFGLALVDSLNLDLDQAINTADDNLYKAKRNGRNRVEF